MARMKPKRAEAFDPRAVAAYSYAEASRVLNVPRSTIQAWKKGQDYVSQARGRVVFEKPIGTDLERGLSYFDLVEVFILRSLRTQHGFKLDYIREAQKIAQDEYGIERLFLHKAFRHDGGSDFFLDELGQLVTLTPALQLAMKETLTDYLKRIDYADDERTASFYPVIRHLGVAAPKLLIVNPSIAFGQPVVKRRGIRTAAIKWRLDAGESRRHIIKDFGLTPDEFDQAIRLEAA